MTSTSALRAPATARVQGAISTHASGNAKALIKRAEEMGVDEAAVELTIDGSTVTAKVTVTDPNPDPSA